MNKYVKSFLVIVTGAFGTHNSAMSAGDTTLHLDLYIPSLPTSLDGLTTESFEQWTIVYNLADRLIEYGDKSVLRPNLVKSYSLSADGREYSFEIDENRFFHNGDPVTIDDIIFSLDLSLRNKNSYSKLRDQLDCLPSSKEEGCGAIKRISSTHFKVRLKEKSISFLDSLNMNENAIRSKKDHKRGKTTYSGCYVPSLISENNLILELNDKHPNAQPQSFKTISIKPLTQNVSELLDRGRGATRSFVMINKGFPTMLSRGAKLSPSSAFQYASGNSFLLSLKADTPQLTLLKSLIHKALFSAGSLSGFPYLKPLSAVYPEGYALGRGFNPPSIKRPLTQERPLAIKYPMNVLSSELVAHLTSLLSSNGLDFKFIPVNAATYKAHLDGSQYDGMIAFPYIDIQDEARVARGYFTGYWNYFPTPKNDLLNILNEAERLTLPDERISKMRSFYSKLLHEYPIIPLFFAPNMLLMSDDLDRRPLDYYGNTIQFSAFKRKP